MTGSGKATVTLPTDEQILITREFDAPKDLVWRAWTEPELVGRWWGGGRGVVMVAHSHGGHEVAFHGEFREIVPDERIVTTEVYESPEASEEDAPLNVVTFSEVDDGRTLLTLLVQCPSKQVRDVIVDSGMEAGMQEGMDLLEEVAISLR